jgi:hypothetical protein
MRFFVTVSYLLHDYYDIVFSKFYNLIFQDKTQEIFLTDKEISAIAMTKKSPTVISSSSLLLSGINI